MSQDVQRQLDVGGLSIAGLASFKPLLAAISADNVDALAILQLRELGTYLHASGKYFERLPDLMRRCNSTRLDRIGLLIGWRKGDVSSAMVESAGGQSIALLCFCLQSLYPEAAGFILSKLARKLLPSGSPSASKAQLQACAELFTSKLQPLGFGNLWAEHVSRLGLVYESLGKKTPKGFFDPLSSESMFEVLHALSKPFTEEDHVVRISGDRGMAEILAICAIVFPDELLIQIDGYTVQEGARQLFILDISNNGSSVPLVRIESNIYRQLGSGLPLSINISNKASRHYTHTYAWDGHLADALTNAFEREGFQISSHLLESIGNFAASAIYGRGNITPRFAHSINNRSQEGAASSQYSSRKTILDLLGSYPRRRVTKTIGEILRVQIQDTGHETYSTALRILKDSFRECTRAKQCSGLCESFDPDGLLVNRPICLIHMLWDHVGHAIIHAMTCTLVSASRNATIKYEGFLFRQNAGPWRAVGPVQILSLFESECNFAKLHDDIMSTWQSLVSRNILAASDGSSSIFPTIVSTLALDLDRGCEYQLVDGQLMLDGYDISKLFSPREVPRRSRGIGSAVKNAKEQLEIRPCLIREYNSISFSLSDLPSRMELLTIVNLPGQSVHVNLYEAVRASMYAVKDQPCEHSPEDPLVLTSKSNVAETTMPFPESDNGVIAIVQTKNDPESQLLSCTRSTRAVIKRDSCLSCAVAYARSLGYNTVIVAA